MEDTMDNFMKTKNCTNPSYFSENCDLLFTWGCGIENPGGRLILLLLLFMEDKFVNSEQTNKKNLDIFFT